MSILFTRGVCTLSPRVYGVVAGIFSVNSHGTTGCLYSDLVITYIENFLLTVSVKEL